jgi:microcystin-dependent protein
MSNPYISQIIMFGGNFTIRNYAACDGQLIAIQQNTALFSLLGTTYGGNGTQTFGLPDLRGRAPFSAGQSPGTSPHPLGGSVGTETVTLNFTNLPNHTHTLQGLGNPGQSADPTGRMPAQGKAGDKDTSQYSANQVNASMASNAVAGAGGNEGHQNMMPSLVINFQIALYGAYPSRS